MSIMDVTKEDVIRLYRTPGHPIAFSSPERIYKYFNGDVSRDLIQGALESIDSYTLHREYKKPRYYNTHYVYHRRSQFQADLIDISSLKKDNDDITFLLMIIDIFTRKAWVMPLKRKTALETRDAFASWIRDMEESGHHPKSILTDSGKEFLNNQIQLLMQSHNIRMDQAKNINKASIVERANKSIQILIYKYLTDRGETRYLDVLQEIMETYNNRRHRSLNGMSPNEADDPDNEEIVRSIHMKKYAKINAHRTKVPKLKKGDTVRIKTYATAPSSARRSYLQQFHGELFKVVKVNRRMPIVMYELMSMNTEENIQGGFYANELMRITGDTFKIEKVLRKRKRGRKVEYLVRWKFFDSRWDSWVDSKDIEVTA